MVFFFAYISLELTNLTVLFGIKKGVGWFTETIPRFRIPSERPELYDNFNIDDVESTFPLDEIIFDTKTLYAYIDDAKHLYAKDKFVREIPEYLKNPETQGFLDELTDTRTYKEKSTDKERGPVEIENEEELAEYAYFLGRNTYYMGLRVSTLNAKIERN